MRFRAKGRQPTPPGQMNKLESKYADHLALRLAAKEIQWFAYEPWKFRLADRTFFTPDFIVLTNEGFIEAHEVKGFWEDDARVKIKVANELHPVKFVAVRLVKKEWQFEEFPS